MISLLRSGWNPITELSLGSRGPTCDTEQHVQGGTTAAQNTKSRVRAGPAADLTAAPSRFHTDDSLRPQTGGCEPLPPSGRSGGLQGRRPGYSEKPVRPVRRAAEASTPGNPPPRCPGPPRCAGHPQARGAQHGPQTNTGRNPHFAPAGVESRRHFTLQAPLAKRQGGKVAVALHPGLGAGVVRRRLDNAPLARAASRPPQRGLWPGQSPPDAPRGATRCLPAPGLGS